MDLCSVDPCGVDPCGVDPCGVNEAPVWSPALWPLEGTAARPPQAPARGPLWFAAAVAAAVWGAVCVQGDGWVQGRL